MNPDDPWDSKEMTDREGCFGCVIVAVALLAGFVAFGELYCAIFGAGR